MERKFTDLYTLQARLKAGVERLFPDRLWVKAEIADLSHKPNGHCYLELSQSEGGGVVARSRAVIWASRFSCIDSYFKSVTGSSLDAGMEILARVQVSFHVLYGLTLTIDEVDPEFTLGEKELRKQRTIERLTKEGWMGLQKQLRLPLLPYNLAVISASGAAGYGDFRRHLLENEQGFVLNPVLFEAVMQGEAAPASIRSALSDSVSGNIHYDAVLILRGGGSELDLSCFDDYDLAVAIARCPVPVFTAIGHDRDHHVADMVACGFVKTPTALADLFLDCYASEDRRLGACSSRLSMAFTNRISFMASRLDLAESRVRRSIGSRLSDASHRVDLLSSRIFQAFKGRLSDASHRVDLLSSRIVQTFRNRVSDAGGHLERISTILRATSLSRVADAGGRLRLLSDRIPRSVESRLARTENLLARTDSRICLQVTKRVASEASRLLLLESRIATTDPRGILRKGFVLALDRDGVKMHSASRSRIGDRVQMMFADGTLKCGVVGIDRRSNVEDGEAPASARESG